MYLNSQRELAYLYAVQKRNSYVKRAKMSSKLPLSWEAQQNNPKDSTPLVKFKKKK